MEILPKLERLIQANVCEAIVAMISVQCDMINCYKL